MKKIFLFGIFLWAGVASLSAQNTVSGTVTDKKGNPIPGAKVEIKGGTESTITELDGTFKLDTKTPAKKVKVYYVGMQPKEQKVKPDMLIKMSDSSWWREKPDKYRWLVGVQVALPEHEDINPAFGLMLGRVKNIGWYVKGVYSKAPDTDGSIEPNDYYYTHWLTGKTKQSYWNATAGFIARLWSPLHVYVGVGYSNRKVAWETFDGSCLEYEPDCYCGAVIECGLMLKVKKFFINGGVMLNNDLNYFKDRVGNFGIGMYF